MAIRFAELDREYGFPEGTMAALILQESGGNVNAVSSAGARGACQFMPETRLEMIREHGIDPWSQDINVAARAGAIYLHAQLERFGSLDQALAAYNCGGGRVSRAIREAGNGWMATLSAETRNYVPSILARIGVDSAELEARWAYGNAANHSDAENAVEAQRRRELLRGFGLSDEAIQDMQPEELLGFMFFAVIAAVIEQASEGLLDVVPGEETLIAGLDVAPQGAGAAQSAIRTPV